MDLDLFLQLQILVFVDKKKHQESNVSKNSIFRCKKFDISLVSLHSEYQIFREFEILFVSFGICMPTIVLLIFVGFFLRVALFFFG